MSRRGLLAAAGGFATITLLSRILGFGRWLVFSSEVGGTCVGQAYATANQVPNVLYEIAAGGALAAIVVPLVGGALAEHDRDTADRIASALLSWAVVVLAPLALAVLLLAGPIAQVMVGETACPGIAADAAVMLRVFAVQVVLYGIAVVLSGVLQAHGRILPAAAAPIWSSLVVIAAYLGYGASSRSQAAMTWILAGGTTLGVVALSLPFVIPIRRIGVRLRPTLSLPSGTAGRARSLALAGMIALAAQQIAVVVTIRLANTHGDVGAVNVYNYVQVVYLLPYAVLAVPLAMSAFPRLVGEEGPTTLTRTLPLVAAAGAFGAALLWSVAQPAGEFFTALDAHPEAMRPMADTLRAFAPGLLGFALLALLTRALYVRGRAVAAGLVTAAGWAVAAVAPVVLLASTERDSQHTLVVLGAASSVGMIVAAAGLLVLVRSGWPGVLEASARRCVAVVLAGALAAFAGHLVGRATPSGLLASAGFGVLAALACLVVFGATVAAGDRSLVGRLLRARSR